MPRTGAITDRRGVIGRQILCVFLAVMIGSRAFDAYASHERIWPVFAVLASAVAIAAHRRFGWTIPCLIIGVCSGLIYDSGIKGGTPESQMWETAITLVWATSIGLFVGVAADWDRRARLPDEH